MDRLWVHAWWMAGGWLDGCCSDTKRLPLSIRLGPETLHGDPVVTHFQGKWGEQGT